MAALNVASKIIPKFWDVLGDVMAHGHTHYWLYGGRGSTKSSFIAICIVLLIISNPQANAVVVRRFGNTLRDSVFHQIIWAVSELGLDGYFRTKISPMELIYLPTGQRIVFRGADDPVKLKGVKFAKGYCALVWFEELDQFASLNAVSSVLNSLRRGGNAFWIFYSYNPPRSPWSWVNSEAVMRVRRADTLVRHSSYLDVMDAHPDWIGLPFIQEAEELRTTNEKAWRWEFLGEVTGSGGNVFSNISDIKLSDADIMKFSRPRNGIDWGWFPDPWVFLRAAYEPGARKLYVFEEHLHHKKTPRETGQIIANAMTFADSPGEDAYFHDQIIWCDDTPDGKVQMATYRREYGLRAHPARKSNMRQLSYEWLAGLREICIDAGRCPNAFREFTLKEYARDHEDRWLNEIPDGNDHTIDALRYAMMDDILRG